MKRDEIEKRVNVVLNEILNLDYSCSEIKDDAVLKDDYGADSIDAVEIVIELEHEFGIYIPEEKVCGNESCTVKDVYDLVEELL